MVTAKSDDERIAYAISGGWREEAWASERTRRNKRKQIRKAAETTTRRILKDGDVINSGGALGIDQYVLNQVLEFGDVESQVNIFLPVERWSYLEYMFGRSDMGGDSVITQNQAYEISEQLQEVMKLAPHAIHDKTKYRAVHPKSYAARNTALIESSDALYAFHVDDTEGVKDAIRKAKEIGIPISVNRYEVAKPGWARKFLRSTYNTGRESLKRNKIGKDLARLLRSATTNPNNN